MTNSNRRWAVFVMADALGIRRVNQFLMAYDLEANDGRGEFLFTPDMLQAMTWDSPNAALRALSESPKCHPVRLNDGMPNRPLRCWTVQLVELPANMIQQQQARQKGN